jgi:hypothetical protein
MRVLRHILTACELLTLQGIKICGALHAVLHRIPTYCVRCVLQGNGIIVGLGICGVIFAATSSAATLMGDFRTGYMCLTAPRAMFVAQLVGQMIGALLAPVAFLLFWGTGQVNVPNGPYPCTFSDMLQCVALMMVLYVWHRFGLGSCAWICGNACGNAWIT